jgi:aminoglycoside 6'-N-acetyltransferase
MEPYAFMRLTADDLPLVREWLGCPHVTERWPDGGDEIAPVIVECDGEEAETVPNPVHLQHRPFARLQCARESSGVRGIDQFIGEADLSNRGDGSTFIRQFCDAPFVSTKKRASARSVPWIRRGAMSF